MRWLFILILFFSSIVLANTALDEVNTILKNRDSTKDINMHVPVKPSIIGQEVYKLSANYEFIFFYRENCPYCQKFAPILKQYSDDTKIHVKAFSFDGSSLALFPESSLVDPNIVTAYFGNNATIAVPALFIMNTTNLHVYPVSSGKLSYVELATRMNEFSPKILQIEEGSMQMPRSEHG